MINSDSEVQVFFRDPRLQATPPGNFSQLYLLRRDIDTCLGINPNTGNPVTHWPKTIWPGVMAILAGVDLLGKFLAGDDTSGQVGIRFRDFLAKYFGLTNNDAELIYQLRNSLLHSFGLYSTSSAGIVHQFTLAISGSQLINTTSSTSTSIDVTVDVECLHNQFETAVNTYLANLQDVSNPSQVQLEQNFTNMFAKHRLVGIR